MSLRQVEEITRILGASAVPWNRAFNGGAVVSPGVASLPHGLKVTLLSPRGADLARLAGVWERELERLQPKRVSSEAAPAPASERSEGRHVFISAAHQDAAWVEEHLMPYLKAMQSRATIAIGDERRFRSARPRDLPAAEQRSDPNGSRRFAEPWQEHLRNVIGQTDAAVVVVSSAALASEWVMKRELPALLERAREGSLRLTWMLRDSCAWQETPLAQFQPLHDVRRPLDKLTRAGRDRVLRDIVRKLEAELGIGPEPRAARDADAGSGPPDVEALARSTFRSDTSAANAASIAFLAEFHDKALLIGGDARADVLCDSIRELLEQRKQPRLRVDAFVVPHGGSAGNLSRELLELLECERYLISSDGSKFKHPSRETIARIITYGRATAESRTTLVFNYRTQVNAVWADPELQDRYRYEAIYPASEAGGIGVVI